MAQAGLDPLAARLWFESVDADRSGLLDAKELRQALDIGGLNYSLLQAHLFVRAFDSQGKHKLNLPEFIELHNFLSSIQDSFDHVARGGRTIGVPEAQQALARMGFSVDATASQAMLMRHDPDMRGQFGRDEWLKMCLFMRTAQRAFAAFDTARAGRVEMAFNQFVYAAAHVA